MTIDLPHFAALCLFGGFALRMLELILIPARWRREDGKPRGGTVDLREYGRRR